MKDEKLREKVTSIEKGVDRFSIEMVDRIEELEQRIRDIGKRVDDIITPIRLQNKPIESGDDPEWQKKELMKLFPIPLDTSIANSIESGKYDESLCQCDLCRMCRDGDYDDYGTDLPDTLRCTLEELDMRYYEPETFFAMKEMNE